MSEQVLCPLRFGPICQYRLWGGRRLGDLLTEPLPGNSPIGEAWVLSDRDDIQSRVADGSVRLSPVASISSRTQADSIDASSSRYETAMEQAKEKAKDRRPVSNSVSNDQGKASEKDGIC